MFIFNPRSNVYFKFHSQWSFQPSFKHLFSTLLWTPCHFKIYFQYKCSVHFNNDAKRSTPSSFVLEIILIFTPTFISSSHSISSSSFIFNPRSDVHSFQPTFVHIFTIICTSFSNFFSTFISELIFNQHFSIHSPFTLVISSIFIFNSHLKSCYNIYFRFSIVTSAPFHVEKNNSSPSTPSASLP